MKQVRKALNAVKYASSRRAWYVSLFAFRGTVWPAVIVRTLFLIVLCIALNIAKHFKHPFPKQKVTSSVHGFVGTAIGLLLVLRTNTSYDRFWEGRRLWGAVTLACKNLLRYVRFHEPNVDITPLGHLLYLYLVALKQRLRNDNTTKFIAPMVNADQLEYIEKSDDKPLAIVNLAADWIRKHCPSLQLPCLAMETCISSLLDAQGGMDRVHSTPIPFSYFSLIHHIVMYYLLTVPFVLVQEMGWYAIVGIILIAGAFLGIEQAGTEIEDPFGTDKNDIPLDQMCKGMKSILLFISTQKVPKENDAMPIHRFLGYDPEEAKNSNAIQPIQENDIAVNLDNTDV